MTTLGAISCLFLLFAISNISLANNNPLSQTELESMIQNLRGDDLRLMRWDATKFTKKRQNDGACELLYEVLSLLSASSSSTVLKGMACEFATFCVTNNPMQRAHFSEYDGVHASVVKLVTSKSSHTSAMACHLIYIASFANQKNHQGFVQEGAVSKLITVIKKPKASKVQIMWAAAALQNLAASYCDTEDDGRCYWKWQKKPNEFVFSLYSNRYTILSDGDAVRQELLGDKELIQKLIKLTCLGPVRGPMTKENPYVGENALVGVHDEASTIVAWAAAGALKNLAIAAEARPLLEPAIPCLCRLSHSPDWLEENKGEGALAHLRPKNPCWFQDNNVRTGKLCVDDAFLDNEGYTCTDYGEASDEECTATDKSGTSANEACCGCGGGDADESWSMTSSQRRSEL